MPALELSTSTLTEGQQIAGCYILTQRASFGYGRELWQARDEVLGRDVSLLFLPETVLNDARAVTELRQEVKRNRQLSHPHILRVYDFVEDGGLAAISMDALDATCVADLLARKGALETQEIKAWVTQLAETLSDAHRIQLFHRDLAPENLFIRPVSKLLVTNFGISRLICEALERVGEARGEAAHLAGMSPQLLDGERPTASDDIYGLGALVFTLLTGRAPFVGDQLVPQIRKSPVPSINDLRAAAGRAPVSSTWEQLVASCLAKMPEQRPRSAGEVVALLAQEKAGAAPSASPGTTATASSAVVAAAAATASAPPAPPAAAQELPAPPVSPATFTPTPTPTPLPTPPVTSPASFATPPSQSQSTPATAKSAPVAATDTVRPVESATRSKPEAPTSPGSAVEVDRTVSSGSAPARPASGSVPNLPPPAPTSKPKPKPAPLSANYPDLDRPKSKLPLVGLILAAAALGTALYFKGDGTSPAPTDGSQNSQVDGAMVPPAIEDPAKPAVDPAVDPAGEKPAIADVTPPTPPIAPAPGENAGDPPTNPPGRAIIGADPEPQPANVTPPTGTLPADPIVVAQNSRRSRPPTGATPVESETPPDANPPAVAPPAPGKTAAYPLPAAPAPLGKLTLPEKATAEQINQLLAERQAAIAEYEKAAAATEKVRSANASMREVRQAEFDEQKKSLEDKRKALAPVIKAAGEADAERKKLEEAMARTEAAAKEAAKAADTAKAAFENLLASSSEKLTARQKAETELKAVNDAFAENTKRIEDLAQGAVKAESQRQSLLLAKRQAEQDVTALNTALEKATKAQREAMVRQNKGKIAGVEKQIQEVDTQVERLQKAVNSLQAIEDDANKPTIAGLQAKIATAAAQKGELQEEIRRLSGQTPTGAKPVSPAPTPAAPAPTPNTPAPRTGAVTVPPVQANLPETPAPTPVAGTLPPAPAQDPANAVGSGATNSLGMKFATVGDVQFSVNLVTVKDFEAFSKAVNLKSEEWRRPSFDQTPQHPVVNVSWKLASRFCKWLTEKERKAGQLKAGEVYRLPSDVEWSQAVGLAQERGSTPEDRDMQIADVYPWGTQWPPPAGAGNFAGEETNIELRIKEYHDDFPNTSPVASFKANQAGLYDMGGNVWQWVEDEFDPSGNAKTLRGGSWFNGSIKMSLLSSCRIKSPAETMNETYGFRIVKANEAKRGR